MATETRLYWFALSHPSRAARLALEHKGVALTKVSLLPGFHPALLRARGFSGITVPAAVIGGEKVQGSIAINRYLEENVAGPSLYPGDAERGGAIADAESWSEANLQEIPRRTFRWAAANRKQMRRWLAAEALGMPLPGLQATINKPVAAGMARLANADEDHVRADLARLPGLLARVEELLDAGIIGGPEPNAADFQIATTIRALLTSEDLTSAVPQRLVAYADRIDPQAIAPAPATLPSDWLPSPTATA